MHLKLLILSTITMTVHANAQTAIKVELPQYPTTRQETEINAVELKTLKRCNFEGARDTDWCAILELTAKADSRVEKAVLKLDYSQSSLTNNLHNSDQYYRLLTTLGEGVPSPTSDVKKYLVKLHFTVYPDAQNESYYTYFLNFYAGMSHGFRNWRSYKLDLSDVDLPSFEFDKYYAYVEGQVKKYPDPNNK